MLPRETMAMQSMKVFKKMCHMGRKFNAEHSEPGLIVGLDNFRDFFSNLTDSMIQFQKYVFVFLQVSCLV